MSVHSRFRAPLLGLRRATLLLCLLAAGHFGPAAAAVVVLEIHLPIDHVGRPGNIKVGDVHKARIFYDDSKVDPRTGIVPVLHMQHFVGRWTPEHLDPVAMPMNDAWLDLHARPYRYHYRSSVEMNGERVLVDFSESGRFSIHLAAPGTLDQAGRLVLSAPIVFQSAPVKDVDVAPVLGVRPSGPAVTMLDMTVAVDRADAASPVKAGATDRARIIYDANAVDPATHRARLLNFQHWIGGDWRPPRPDPVMMPVSDMWIDLGAMPYRLHAKAFVTHGQPVIIDADAATRRLTIHPQSNPGGSLMSGRYTIDPRPITGPEVDVAGGGRPALTPQ